VQDEVIHICPYGAMAIFILNKISLLEPRTQNCVRSAKKNKKIRLKKYLSLVQGVRLKHASFASKKVFVLDGE
jgi:hypothetical protein